MKTRSFLKAAALLAFLCVFASCAQEEVMDNPVDGNGGEKVDVRMTLVGDILELGNLTTRSGAESLDLFGLRIFRSPLGSDNYTFYAYGLFDDMELAMNFSLLTGYKYYIQATLIPNGKYKVYGAHWEENNVLYHSYKEPFSVDLTNQLQFSGPGYNFYTYNELINASHCCTERILPDEGRSQGIYAEVDRLYGEVINYVPTTNSNVTLSMKRVSSRLVFNVKQLKTYITVEPTYNVYGKTLLYIYGNPQGAPSQTIKFLSLKGEETLVNSDGYSYTDYIYTPQWLANPIDQAPLRITWYREDGTAQILLDETVTLQAGKTKIFDFDLSSYYGSRPVIELPGDDWD